MHEKIVTMQIQTMFQMLRQSVRSVHEFCSKERPLIGRIMPASIE